LRTDRGKVEFFLIKSTLSDRAFGSSPSNRRTFDIQEKRGQKGLFRGVLSAFFPGPVGAEIKNKRPSPALSPVLGIGDARARIFEASLVFPLSGEYG
jgi:hypothetical protein